MVQLDALRAFAVLAVLLSHFTLYTRHVFGVIQRIDLAGFGVRLFFVISGFLITGILLRSKEFCENEHMSLWHGLRQFYARRFLRIFPLFYLALGVAAMLNIPPVRETWWWHASYLTNLYLFQQGWDGSINHFWSLAVEEQFYLIWPWIIFLVDRRTLGATILIVVAIGPIFRLLCGLYTGNDRTPILFLSCLDTLGTGAYLALLRDRLLVHKSPQPAVKLALFPGLVILLLFLGLCAVRTSSLVRYVVFDLAAALIGGYLVWTASTGFRGLTGWILEMKWLTYLGTISYGIYVYHNFLPWLLDRTFKGMFRMPHAWFIDVLVMCGATIAVAAVSWHLFERPINKLKKHFRY